MTHLDVNHHDNASADVFISYTGQDADGVARPLATELTRRGCRVWFAEYELRLGDSLRAKINHGLAACRFGVVILSPAFFSKQWTTFELDGLTAREITEAKKIILPIWHQIDREGVARHSPTLADRLAVSTKDGIAVVASRILAVLSPAERLAEDAETIGSLVANYAEYWRQNRVLLDRSFLSLLYERRSAITMTGDAWLMIAESASDKREIRRWIELVPAHLAWAGLKAVLRDSASHEARSAAGELLGDGFATGQEDYDSVVSSFLASEKDSDVLRRAVPAVVQSKRQAFLPGN